MLYLNSNLAFFFQEPFSSNLFWYDFHVIEAPFVSSSTYNLTYLAYLLKKAIEQGLL